MTFVYASLALFLMFWAVIAVPVFLGIYVYQDARSRGMEPWLWALIAVLAPGFIGLIIYLVVRKDHLIAKCPQCGSEVQEGFVSCPACGQKLSASCRNCGTALRPEWKLCPTCGTEITEAEPFTPPVVARPANKKLFGALLVSLLLPIGLFLLLAMAGFLGMMFVANYDEVDVTESDVWNVSYTDAEDTIEYYGVDIMEDEFKNDAMLTIVSEFNDKTDYRECRLMSLQASPLGQETSDWVAACKKGEKGIYANTYYLATDGGFAGILGKGSYDMDYAYTVIVFNPEKAVQYACDDSIFEHQGEETWLVTENIEISFSDPNTEEERVIREIKQKDAAPIDNVFVIEHPYAYTIDYSFTLGKSYQLKAKAKSKSMRLTLENGNVTEDGSATYMTKYTIPFDTDKNGFYTPFQEVR